MDYTLEEFTNNLENITDDLNHWSIDKIHRKDGSDFRFLKWDKTVLDDVCPRDCSCQWAEEMGEDFECKRLEIPYYVYQWSVGDSGDSFQGVMVFDLVDYYVEMSYSI